MANDGDVFLPSLIDTLCVTTANYSKNILKLRANDDLNYLVVIVGIPAEDLKLFRNVLKHCLTCVLERERKF